jgi:hypothetical protein
LRKSIFGLVIALFTLLALPLPTHAQSALHLSEVQVELWPEFDEPAVLVICHITLASNTIFPATLDLRIPSVANLNAVAERDSNGSLVNATYEQKADGDWRVLSLQVTRPRVQVEYYDLLTKQGTARNYTYTWAGDNTVDSFSIVFQEPVDATALILDPPGITNWTGNDHLNYYQTNAVALAAGQVYTFQVKYNKTTETLSGSGLPVQPAGTLVPDTLTNIWPWVAGGVGLLFLLGGVIGILRLRPIPARAPRGHGKRHAASYAGAADQVASEAYCHQCGQRSQPADLFCRVCGTRLKHED